MLWFVESLGTVTVVVVGLIPKEFAMIQMQSSDLN